MKPDRLKIAGDLNCGVHYNETHRDCDDTMSEKLVIIGNGWVRGLNGGVNLDSAPCREVTTRLYSLEQKERNRSEFTPVQTVASLAVPRFECVV